MGFLKYLFFFLFFSKFDESLSLTHYLQPLENVSECIHNRNILEPVCIFESVNYSAQAQCIQHNVLLIKGDYKTLRIFCKANYAIDFFYFGHQPTEAINVTWTKKIQPNTNGKNITFELELLIRSVQELHDVYCKHTQNLQSCSNNISEKSYTRSGEYLIKGIFNTSLEKSFFIYFEEDGIKPVFLRNSKTSDIILEGNNMIFPCLASHHSNISVVPVLPEQFRELIIANSIVIHPTRGIIIPIPSNTTVSGLFSCKLVNTQNGLAVDQLSFTLPNNTKGGMYGLEEFPSLVQGFLELNYKLSVKGKYRINIQPWCRMESLNEPNVLLSTVPSHNFAYLRLVREFVLPQFVNLSYTVRKGTQMLELSQELWTSEEDSLHDRFGTSFCLSGKNYRLTEYGTGHDGEVIPITFGKDWIGLPRDGAPIEVFLQLKLLNHTEGDQLFTNTVMKIQCRVHEAVITKPTIWYSERTNGSVFEELIDYNWDGPYSYLTKNVTSDIKKIICSGGYWYASNWRNISLALDLVEGSLPIIKSSILNSKFKLGLNGQFISCEFTGNPQPQAYWEVNGLNASTTGGKVIKTQASKLIFDFSNFQKSQVGEYVCRVENRFGKTHKIFKVEMDEDASNINYGIIIGIPAALTFIVTIVLYIYVRKGKKQQIGLTRPEIDEFLNGKADYQYKNKNMSVMNDEYAHEFVPDTPYEPSNEIPKSKYQIDKFTILGRGAYGTVFKGILRGQPVAVKTVNEYAEKTYLKALLSELKVMIFLGRHENIVEFLGSNTSDLDIGRVYIFVELCACGSMEKYLRDNRKIYSEFENNSLYTEKLFTWAKEIALGMNYLESKKVIHGDLAARNVLLTKTHNAKITDFGLSRKLYDYANYVKKNQEPLPWRWLALESIKYLTFSFKSDVWSYGICLWELFSLGEVPYPGCSWNVGFVEELDKGMRMRKPKFAPNILYETVLRECWNENIQERPSFMTLHSRLCEIEKGLKQNGYDNLCDDGDGKNVIDEDQHRYVNP